MFTEWTKSAPIPINKVKTIVEAFHVLHPQETSFANYMEDLIVLMDQHEYQVKWNTSTRLNHLITQKNGELYLEFLVTKGDKTLVPSHLRTTLQPVADRVRYLNQDLLRYAETQYPVFFDVDGVACKALLDIVVETEDQAELIDLKYTNVPLDSFQAIIRALRYDIQLSFYSYGLQKLLNKKVVPSLLVYSAVDDDVQRFYLSDLDLQIAEWGAEKDNGTIRINGYEIANTTVIKGWRNYFNKDNKGVINESIWN